MDMRRHTKVSYPIPPRKFDSLEHVLDYLMRLYRVLSESRSAGYAGNIVQSDSVPTSADGVDGDIWVQYKN